MRVYFCGASGVGKSTLARLVQERHGATLLPSAGRDVLAELEETDPGRVLHDLSFSDQFHRRVWRRQLELEHAAGANFVSERSVDYAAYAALFSRVGWEVARNEEWHNYLARLHEPEAVLFFVRPHPNLVLKDGRRDGFLEPGLVAHLDGALTYLLASHDIPHINVAGDSLAERARLVDNVLKLLPR